jgi:hypothetical protein
MRKRPSRFGYWLGGAIFVVGIAGGVAILVIGFMRISGTVQDFQRVPVPGQAEVTLEAGEQVVYVEPNEGGGDAPPPSDSVDVAVIAADTRAPVPLSRYGGSFNYDFGGYSGRAYRTFRAEAPGSYAVTTRALATPVTGVAIGPPIGRRFVTILLAGIALLIVGPLVGLVIVIVTAILRYVRRPDRQGGAAAGAPTAPTTATASGAPPTTATAPGTSAPAGAAARGATAAAAPAPAARPAPPPAGWYADPHGQARLRYWDGSRWTGHTAA